VRLDATHDDPARSSNRQSLPVFYSKRGLRIQDRPAHRLTFCDLPPGNIYKNEPAWHEKPIFFDTTIEWDRPDALPNAIVKAVRRRSIPIPISF
jgi:hypothetical protein